MTLEKLRELYRAMNVTFKDDATLQRAILYYDQVQSIDQSLPEIIKPELKGILGGYEKVEQAITRSSLLTSLCSILDDYIVPIINDSLKKSRLTYGQYFQDIFDHYPNSASTVLSNYPNTHRALGKIATYFQTNILTACKRVVNDWGYLQGTFVEQKGNFLDKLIDIQATGSDFHKGGQQVLILTFRTTSSAKPLRIVYKPSDLEVDCLIAGNTEAVNFFRPHFQQASLMEILNGFVKQYQLALEEFPTYKILPIYPGSQLQPDKPNHLPIRNSYGYIQFLTHDDEDFKINPQTQKKDAICTSFYTLLGQLTAVACVFSLSDLHIDNLIVHQYKPYLIDLENSLTRPINHILDTEMVGEAGAVEDITQSVSTFVVKDDSTQIEEAARYQLGKNRLWEAPNAPISTSDYYKSMLAGFGNTMQLIQLALKEGKALDEWFARLRAGAIVRIVPLGTLQFHSTITNACKPKNVQTIEVAIQQQMQQDLLQAYNRWIKDQTSPPYFLCLQQTSTIQDLVNFDIPVFYHRLNSCDVMDSRGTIITIPDTTPTDNKPLKELLKRETFFSTPPLKYLQTIQLGDVNTGNTSPAKVKDLLGQLQNHINSRRDVEKYAEYVRNKQLIQ